MGRGGAPRWVIRKVAPGKSHNRPRMARNTRWWRMLSNRLRELSLMEAIPTRRPHLPQQPEQIERLRTHLRRMAKEARTNEGCAEIWRLATQTYGESELQDLKDVHWKALTVLDKLHRRDRRVREKGIAEYAREASKGAAGLLHRLTKPRAVRCQRDSAQGEATKPRDAAELAANGWVRIWRVHVEELRTAERPQTVRTRLFCLSSQVTDRGWFCDAVVRLVQGQNGHWCRCGFIPQYGRASQKRANNCTPTC